MFIIFSIIVIIIMLFIFYRGADVPTGVVISEIERNDKFTVDKVIFKGEDGKEIYALFFKPKKEEFDVVIVLPGAEGTKESRRKYADILLEMGIGSFILDQRGIGETGGEINNFQKDFESYLNGGEVFQYLMAEDVISAASYLNNLREVDEIGVLGESMGGGNAMIAAGLDKRIKIAVIISSAGYDIGFGEVRANEFIAYINPNSYIGRISPRRLLMLHSN